MSYPRQDLERERWLSLDGRWEFAFDPKDKGIKEAWYLRTLPLAITVPYCVESEASGVANQRRSPVFWYAKQFPRTALPEGRRFFIYFGAVDWEADVWINGNRLGRHRGGYTPFSFEITDYLADTNRIAVRVADRPTKRTLRGKQYIYRRLSPVFYTPASGIWQPVYIYATGDTHIEGLTVLPDRDSLVMRARADAPDGTRCEVSIVDADGVSAARETLPVVGGAVEKTIVVKNPRRWSIESPHLYRVEVSVLDKTGDVSDRVVCRTGLRRVEAKGGRVLLNGEPVYLKMLLVQGYYPGGHYTPADEKEIEREVVLYKSMGFNGVRLHEKIEDPRYLDCCDRHGLLVWEEMPSPFLFGGLDEVQYEHELDEVLLRDASHPSITAVVLFNETWGIYDLWWSKKRRRFLRSMYDRVHAFNPHMPVVDNSGYDHLITDIADVHHYLDAEHKIEGLYQTLGDMRRMSRQWFKIPRAVVNIIFTHLLPRKTYLRQGVYRGDEPFVVSEFGGAGYYKGSGDFMENFEQNVRIMARYPIITGYCLTQAYDVENEQNGILNFDRSPKYPAQKVRAVNDLTKIHK